MQYMLLIYEDETVYGDKHDSPAVMEIVQRHMAFGEGLGAARKGGAGLVPTNMATTVVTRSGTQTVHDGPFAETREQLGGFVLIEAKDLNDALHVAAKIPPGRIGSIEVRPVWDLKQP